jgi:ADP-ribose pyrophosphatase YjhB (NUDIX family)
MEKGRDKRVSVVVTFLDMDQVLLVMPKERGEWVLPSADIEEGETLYQTAQRAFFEVTGLIPQLNEWGRFIPRDGQERIVVFRGSVSSQDFIAKVDPQKIKGISFFHTLSLPKEIDYRDSRLLWHFFPHGW